MWNEDLLQVEISLEFVQLVDCDIVAEYPKMDLSALKAFRLLPSSLRQCKTLSNKAKQRKLHAWRIVYKTTYVLSMMSEPQTP